MTIQKYTTQLFSISANEQRKSDMYYFKVLKEQDKWMCCWLSSHEQGNERLWASEEPEAGGPSLLFVMLSRWSWSYCQPGKASVPWQPLFLQHCSFNWRPSLLVSWVAVARFHVKALPMKTKKHQNKQKPGINWSEYPEHLGDTKWSRAFILSWIQQYLSHSQGSTDAAQVLFGTVLQHLCPWVLLHFALSIPSPFSISKGSVRMDQGLYLCCFWVYGRDPPLVESFACPRGSPLRFISK